MAWLSDFCLGQGFERTYWIAYSGGRDSHVLLHQLTQLRHSFPQLNLRAIHVHHGLSPHADAWAAHCQQICADLNVDFVLRKISAKSTLGESPEDIARQRRYAVFSELLAENDLLLTAHHQNDQAETVLLQLLRGAGPKGLAAMPVRKKLGRGWHIRPLLGMTRAELTDYAEQHQLKWIEDESNDNTDFSRNFIRNQVLPILEQRWPTTVNTLSRVAENCAHAQQIVDAIARDDLKKTKKNQQVLSIQALNSLSDARKRQVLRLWFSQQDIKMPSSKKMQQILTCLLQAGQDRFPCVEWSGVQLQRYRDDLYLMPQENLDVKKEGTSWNLQEELLLPGVGKLIATPSQGMGMKANVEQAIVSFRKGGERCRLPGRAFHHSLKKLFQTWGIPLWERDRIPLVFVGQELAAVVGFTICDGFQAQPGEKGYELAVVPPLGL